MHPLSKRRAGATAAKAIHEENSPVQARLWRTPRRRRAFFLILITMMMMMVEREGDAAVAVCVRVSARGLGKPRLSAVFDADPFLRSGVAGG